MHQTQKDSYYQHTDIKPSNIITNEKEELKTIDNDDVTKVGEQRQVYTPGYNANDTTVNHIGKAVTPNTDDAGYNKIYDKIDS